MFEQIAGHQQNKEFLARFLLREERPHALLFYGPEGIGKCLLAKEFARAFLCQGPAEQKRPCDRCESCRLLNFTAGNLAHPDYLYLDPATGEAQEKKKLKIISVSQIRGLLSQAAYGPTLSAHKICLINEADTMNAESANSLLKLLEEPPENWFFILIATSVSQLLPTILSRVIQVRFTPLTEAEARQVLAAKGCSAAEAELLAALADGSPGRGLRFKEAGVVNLRNRALEFMEALPLPAPMTYLIGEEYFADVIPVTDSNESLQYFLSMLTALLRDLLFIRTGLRQHLFNRDVADRLAAIAGRWEPEGLQRSVAFAQEAAAAAARRANTKSILDDITFTINGYCGGRI